MTRIAELRELAAAWNAAWNGRDPDTLAAFFTEDATYYEPGLESGPVLAHAGIKGAASKTWQDWPGATFQTVSLTIEGSRVALEWRSSATHRSGAEVTLEGVDILEWDGDKVTSARVYYDEHSRKLALGQA
jgi:ketosteroid isomerase-like protein